MRTYILPLALAAILLSGLRPLAAQEQTLGVEGLKLIEIRGNNRKEAEPKDADTTAKPDDAPATQANSNRNSRLGDSFFQGLRNTSQDSAQNTAEPAVTSTLGSATKTPDYDVEKIIKATVEATQASRQDDRWEDIEAEINRKVASLEGISKQLEHAVQESSKSNVELTKTLASRLAAPQPAATPPPASTQTSRESHWSSAENLPWVLLACAAVAISLVALLVNVVRSPRQHLATTNTPQATTHHDTRPTAAAGDLARQDVILSMNSYAATRQEQAKKTDQANDAVLSQILQDNLDLSKQIS